MKIVFVNGTFDVLHRGHIELLRTAKSLGDYLIVAIDSDDRVLEKKGLGRPFNNEIDRVDMLRAIRYVNEVMIFKNDNDLESLVKLFQPDIMMVGSDWKGQNIIGSKYAKELRFFDRIDGYSTTKILNRSGDEVRN